MDRSHVHNWALAALVDGWLRDTGNTKADLARESEITPGQLADLLSGRRAGHNQTIRARIAVALDVDARALTCWCDDRPGNHGGA